MSQEFKYKNESKKTQKVYVAGVTGPWRLLEPDEVCMVRLDADQEVRVEEVKTPRAKKAECE